MLQTALTALLLSLLLLLLPHVAAMATPAATTCTSFDAAAPGVLTLMKSDSSDSLTYWLFKPASCISVSSCPVLLFLHGAGGVNNPTNIRGQSLTRMLDIDADYAARCKHIVVMPVAPERGWPQHGKAVMELLDEVMAASGADADRVAIA